MDKYSFWEGTYMLVARKMLFWIIFIFLFFVIFFAFCALLNFIQEKLFLSQDYIMWVSKYPISRLIFIFEFYLVFLLFKNLWSNVFIFVKRHKRWVYLTFLLINLVLLYALISNVSVITKNKVIDYTFFSPKGKVYNYSDIVKIDTGVYGKWRLIPFNNKGQFYYVLTLKDGTTIDLNGDAGGTNNRDIYEVFEDIDKNLVDRGIKKTASMANFELFKKNLDQIYVDRIKRILTNRK